MIICVTGPMAAGKNAASDILEKHGYSCIDADLAAHTAIENAKDKIIAEFGNLAKEKNINLLTDDGHVNRKNLGKIVFTSPDLVAKQESIVYPEINRILESFALSHEKCVINATVLYKVPLIKKVSFVIYVDSFPLKRFIRAKKRDRLSFKQIYLRFKAQKNLFAKYKSSNADIVRVWNIGSRKKLETKILKILSSQ